MEMMEFKFFNNEIYEDKYYLNLPGVLYLIGIQNTPFPLPNTQNSYMMVYPIRTINKQYIINLIDTNIRNYVSIDVYNNDRLLTRCKFFNPVFPERPLDQNCIFFTFDYHTLNTNYNLRHENV